MHHTGYSSAVVLIALFFLLSCGCLNSGEDSRAWNAKGETYHTLERYEEAVAAFDTAITMNPKNGEAWRNRGLSLSRLNRSDEAEESYVKALELNADDSEAYYFRALSLDAAGNISYALENIDKAILIVPKSRDDAILLSQCWTLRGDLLVKMNRGDEANESYRRAHEVMAMTI